MSLQKPLLKRKVVHHLFKNMALTNEQRSALDNNQKLQSIISPKKTEPDVIKKEATTVKERIEIRRQERQNRKSQVDTNKAQTEIPLEEIKKTTEEVMRSGKAGKVLGTGFDILIKPVARALARPAVELARGVEELKTGKEVENIDVPALGEFEKPGLGSAAGEVFEVATSFFPAEKLLKPFAFAAGKVSETLKAAKPFIDDVENLVGKITRGKGKDILKAKKALKTIDTTGVKTFDDLSKVSSDAVTGLINKQDEIFGAFGNKIPLTDLTTKVGGEARNFVSKALDDLEEVYTKTNDIENLALIKEARKYALTEGLNAKEINELARFYNAELASKAFSERTGEALTSVNKVGLENVRKQLKKLATDNIPDKREIEALKELDTNISNLYTLKRTSEKMSEGVRNLQNKLTERGLLEQLANKVGKVINVALLKTPQGLMTSLVPSNVGNKALNYVEVEKQLSSVLKKINNLDEASDKEIMDTLSQLILQNLGKAGVRAITPEE